MRIVVYERYRLKFISLTETFVTNDLGLADFQISLYFLAGEIVPGELNI